MPKPEDQSTAEIAEVIETAEAIITHESLTEAKVQAGLPREIAQEVAKNQLLHNARLAEVAAAQEKAAKKAAKETAKGK